MRPEQAKEVGSRPKLSLIIEVEHKEEPQNGGELTRMI